MIQVTNLTKHYGSKRAVDNISFTVNKGEIVGFLGPNGAGKTTTMNILTGYIGSSGGTATIDGFDVLKSPNEAKKRIGYMPEQPPLYLDMTVRDYLSFAYDLKGIKLKKEAHIKECMELVKIVDVQKRLIKNLSKGYKQRVGLAGSLLGNPEILILDEPTVGLDPKQINEIRELIKNLGKQRTVILSSHILPEVQAICERVIIINHGKIVASDTPENLSHNLSGKNRLLARIVGNRQSVTEVIQSIPSVKFVSAKACSDDGASEYNIETDGTADIRKSLFFALAKKEMPLLMLTNQMLTLEDVFLQVTKSDTARSILIDEKPHDDPEAAEQTEQSEVNQ